MKKGIKSRTKKRVQRSDPPSLEQSIKVTTEQTIERDAFEFQPKDNDANKGRNVALATPIQFVFFV